jgi:hypothetical protein
VLPYSSPDENSGVPKRVVVKPDSKVDFLTVEADVDMKQLDTSTASFGANDPIKDGMQIPTRPKHRAGLQVSVNGKEGSVQLSAKTY